MNQAIFSMSVGLQGSQGFHLVAEKTLTKTQKYDPSASLPLPQGCLKTTHQVFLQIHQMFNVVYVDVCLCICSLYIITSQVPEITLGIIDAFPDIVSTQHYRLAALVMGGVPQTRYYNSLAIQTNV